MLLACQGKNINLKQEIKEMKGNKIIYQVDAFTSVPFRGNPAGVCILDEKPPSEWMQNIAMEMNLSETAFVYPGEGGNNLRFYTPETEIDLCGHATLSTGHIIFETGFAGKNETVALNSKAGVLKVSYAGGMIRMDFPSFPPEKVEIPDEINNIIGIRPLELYRSGHGWTLALLKDESDVRNMKPDFTGMRDKELGQMIITALSEDKNYDFCVRCFAPGVGINEDPVTGSAHCTLAPFWNSKTGMTEFVSHQVSKREGVLKVALRNARVEISGHAITIFKAGLLV